MAALQAQERGGGPEAAALPGGGFQALVFRCPWPPFLRPGRGQEEGSGARDRSEYYMDDVAMLQLLKGLCLKHLGRLMQAELCFNQVIQSEKQIKYDNYLVPFTLYELGLLYKQQDERGKAIRFIETAKNNYKEYSMESRLHFRIHAALDSLKVTPASTP